MGILRYTQDDSAMVDYGPGGPNPPYNSFALSAIILPHLVLRDQTPRLSKLDVLVDLLK